MKPLLVSSLLKQWCAKNVTDPKLVSDLAVGAIVERGALGEREATQRVRELLRAVRR